MLRGVVLLLGLEVEGAKVDGEGTQKRRVRPKRLRNLRADHVQNCCVRTRSPLTPPSMYSSSYTEL